MKRQTLRFAELAHQAAEKGLTLERGDKRYTLRWPDGRIIVALYSLEILAPIVALVPVREEYEIWRDE
jgi:hypothetical protein